MSTISSKAARPIGQAASQLMSIHTRSDAKTPKRPRHQSVADATSNMVVVLFFILYPLNRSLLLPAV